MIAIGKMMLGVLLLAVAAATLAACANTDSGSGRRVDVGGNYGVVVDQPPAGQSGTLVRIGGDKGVVVNGSSSPQPGTSVKIGGASIVNTGSASQPGQ